MKYAHFWPQQNFFCGNIIRFCIKKVEVISSPLAKYYHDTINSCKQWETKDGMHNSICTPFLHDVRLNLHCSPMISYSIRIQFKKALQLACFITSFKIPELHHVVNILKKQTHLNNFLRFSQDLQKSIGHIV